MSDIIKRLRAEYAETIWPSENNVLLAAIAEIEHLRNERNEWCRRERKARDQIEQSHDTLKHIHWMMGQEGVPNQISEDVCDMIDRTLPTKDSDSQRPDVSGDRLTKREDHVNILGFTFQVMAGAPDDCIFFFHDGRYVGRIEFDLDADTTVSSQEVAVDSGGWDFCDDGVMRRGKALETYIAAVSSHGALPNFCSGCGERFTACKQELPECVPTFPVVDEQKMPDLKGHAHFCSMVTKQGLGWTPTCDCGADESEQKPKRGIK